MNAIKRMGVLYGRLGLATDPDLIERRTAGVKAAAEHMKRKDIPAMLRAVFGLGSGTEPFAFLVHFSGPDPTFDVGPGDREAALLAGSVVAYEIESQTAISATLALALVTAAFGGVRRPVVDDQLVAVAEGSLAQHQGEAGVAPRDREYNKQPETLTTAIQSVSTTGQHIQNVMPNVITAMQELGKYAEANALATAQGDNFVLAHVRQLEQELRIYWWASGGWSADADRPFRKLPSDEAALRAGKELADKMPGPLGLFAAPALIDMVVERGREGDLPRTTLRDAAIRPDRAWRSVELGATSAGPLADLLPVTAALGFAADSEDADDWQPRFRRSTGIDPSVEMDPVELGLQLYRECLTARALA